MAGTVAARNVHFRIAALHHRRIAEILVGVFRSLLAPYHDQFRVSKLKKRPPILFPGTIQT
jgi:hypothetical protein